MPISLNHLGCNRRRLQPERPAGIRFDVGRKMREGTDRTRQLADRDDLTGVLNAEYRAKALERIPLGRFAKPDEMAEIALFMLSSKAGYMTGQVLQVDGGLAI